MFNNLRQCYRTDEVTIVCSHQHPSASAFLAAHEAYLEPAELSGQAYLHWCLSFCKAHRVDLFWPGKEAALISKNHSQFHAMGVQVLSVADYDTLMLLQNKADFYRALRPEVAKVMDFIAVHTADEFDAAVAVLAERHAKLCVKPAVSVYGLGFRVLDRQLDSITQLLKGVEYQIPLAELRQGMGNTPIFDCLLVMEHLPGSEWSVDCAGRQGELLCAVQRKKSQLPGYGQSIGHDPEIAAMVERLTMEYRLNGIFNIQFKEGVAGPRLLEINPRPSGGFGMACLAGANLAQIALQGFKGLEFALPALNLGLKMTEVNTPVVLQEQVEPGVWGREW